MDAAFMRKHFADNVVCACRMLELYAAIQHVPQAIMQLLQYKLFQRCRLIYRTYIVKQGMLDDPSLQQLDDTLCRLSPSLYRATGNLLLSKPLLPVRYIKLWRSNHHGAALRTAIRLYQLVH